VFGSTAPNKEDVLFGATDDWQSNACIGDIEPEWLYSSGFRMAAQRLVSEVCETASNQDMLIYPIVYLYRHHVELVLKEIIRSASRLLDRELLGSDLRALGRHGLAALWQIARPLLNPVCESAGNTPFPDNELCGVDSYINQIHQHDPDGQRFRYATGKANGDNRTGVVHSLRPALTLVNIRALATGMEKLADYLEGIEGWFGDLEDAKNEWERHSSEGA
jgi:hypothetical protein